jgi:hypothetical protein
VQIGTASLAIGGTGLANTALIFRVAGCFAGAVYTIEVICRRTDGDTVEGWTRLACAGPD